MNSIRDIKHVVYINLDHRTDRRVEVERELENVGLLGVAERYSATKAKDGRIGCTLSHLRCIQTAKKKGLSHLMLVEDDIQFLKPTVFTEQLNKFLQSGIEWDMILLAGNNLPPHIQVHESAIKVSRCQTTTGYIINRHYYDTLINNMREGITNLMKQPSQHFHYAIDKFWFRLQMRDRWFLITPLTVTQRESFSDIEQRTTNYTRAMIDLDKEEFLRSTKMRLNNTPTQSP